MNVEQTSTSVIAIQQSVGKISISNPALDEAMHRVSAMVRARVATDGTPLSKEDIEAMRLVHAALMSREPITHVSASASTDGAASRVRRRWPK